jgi:hypothetical protein
VIALTFCEIVKWTKLAIIANTLICPVAMSRAFIAAIKMIGNRKKVLALARTELTPRLA